MKRQNKAQSVGEYILTVTIVILVGIAMFPLIKRGSQSLIKAGADQIGLQEDADQKFDDKYGYMVLSNSEINTQVNNQSVYEWGRMNVVKNESMNMETNSYSKAGITEF